MNLHGGLIINETLGVWLLLYKLPVTSAFALSQETLRNSTLRLWEAKEKVLDSGQAVWKGAGTLFFGPREHFGMTENMVNRIL